MNQITNQSRLQPDCAESPFPEPRIRSTWRLKPLRSWREVHEEMGVTGIEFDAFWYEAVMDGACTMCRWLGESRGTVLIVYGDDGIGHVECRGAGDRLMTPEETAAINEEVMKAMGREDPLVAPVLH